MLIVQYELVKVYHLNNQPRKSMKLFERLMKVYKKLTEDAGPQLSAQLWLAVTYREEGRVEKAIELLEHVVKV